MSSYFSRVNFVFGTGSDVQATTACKEKLNVKYLKYIYFTNITQVKKK